MVGDDRPRRDPLPCLIGPCLIAALMAANRLTLPLTCPLLVSEASAGTIRVAPARYRDGAGGLSNSYGASQGE